jgi:hypothetical protein
MVNPDRLALERPGDHRDPGGEVAEHLAELVGVDRHGKDCRPGRPSRHLDDVRSLAGDAAVIDKPTLRRRMRQACELVDDRTLRSVTLWARIAELPQYSTAHTVMAFASMPSEPDTDGLFARLERDGKVLVLPRIVGDALEAGTRRRRGTIWCDPAGAQTSS